MEQTNHSIILSMHTKRLLPATEIRKPDAKQLAAHKDRKPVSSAQIQELNNNTTIQQQIPKGLQAATKRSKIHEQKEAVHMRTSSHTSEASYKAI